MNFFDDDQEDSNEIAIINHLKENHHAGSTAGNTREATEMCCMRNMWISHINLP